MSAEHVCEKERQAKACLVAGPDDSWHVVAGRDRLLVGHVFGRNVLGQRLAALAVLPLGQAHLAPGIVDEAQRVSCQGLGLARRHLAILQGHDGLVVLSRLALALLVKSIGLHPLDVDLAPLL